MRLLIMALLTLAVVAVLIGVVVAFAVVLSLIAQFLFGPAVARFAGLLAIVLAWWLPWRWLAWPKPYVVVGSAEIDAPPARVWEEVMLHERDDHYQRALPIIREVDAEAGRFAMRFHDDAQLDGDPVPDVQVQIEFVEPQRRFRYRVLNAHEMPLWAKDHVASEFELTPLDGGTRTRITLRETLRKLHILAFLMLIYLNPCRDSMTSLKARIEGTGDPSWMGGEMDALSSGSTTTPGARDFLGVGYMVALVITLVAIALVWQTLR